MRLQQFIIERSFTPSNIPKTFRVVIDIDNRTNDQLNQLSNMRLKGVKGISDSGEIAYDFLGIGRNALLIMDGPEVVKLNKLSRFMYDNPHYFFSENMANLKRLYQKNINDNRGTWHNVADKVFAQLGKEGRINTYELKANAPGQEISYTKTVKDTTVNSLRDAVKTFRKAMEEVMAKDRKYGNPYWYFADLLKLSDKELTTSFIKAFKDNIGDIYKDEGEWIVKDSELKIPKNSFLYILVTYDEMADKYKKGKLGPFEIMRYEDKIKEEQDFIDRINKILKGKYKIKYLSRTKWEKVRNIHQEKRWSK